MPVTKTAKRALRGSERKAAVNTRTRVSIDTLIRVAKRDKTEKQVRLASSALDRAAKKKYIHPNKAARLKSALSKLLVK